MIHINLNMIFYTHVEHSPTKTIYIKYYKQIITYRKKVSLKASKHGAQRPQKPQGLLGTGRSGGRGYGGGG